MNKFFLFGDSHTKSFYKKDTTNVIENGIKFRKLINNSKDINIYKFVGHTMNGFSSLNKEKPAEIIINIIKNIRYKNKYKYIFMFGFVDIIYSYYYVMLKDKKVNNLIKFIEKICYPFINYLLYLKNTYKIEIYVLSVLPYNIINKNNIIDNIIINISMSKYNIYNYRRYVYSEHTNSLYLKNKLTKNEKYLKRNSIKNYDIILNAILEDSNPNKSINDRIIMLNSYLKKILKKNKIHFIDISSNIHIQNKKTIDHHYNELFI